MGASGSDGLRYPSLFLVALNHVFSAGTDWFTPRRSAPGRSKLEFSKVISQHRHSKGCVVPNGVRHIEVLDVLPHVSQTIDAFCGAKPKDFVIASGC